MTALRVVGSTYAKWANENNGVDNFDSRKGVWGQYLLYKYNQTTPATNLKQRKEFQRWYTNQLGFTVFDSTRTTPSLLAGKYEK